MMRDDESGGKRTTVLPLFKTMMDIHGDISEMFELFRKMMGPDSDDGSAESVALQLLPVDCFGRI
jgi:hypothetical protein